MDVFLHSLQYRDLNFIFGCTFASPKWTPPYTSKLVAPELFVPYHLLSPKWSLPYLYLPGDLFRTLL